MTPTATYCTIIARNYLPKALALAESLVRHMDGAVLHILVIDEQDLSSLPAENGVVYLRTGELDLTPEHVLDLAMMYDVVELATAVKPLLLGKLLRDYEQVSYLDPDTYVVSPMTELSPAIEASANGLLLTPHYLEPVPEGQQHFLESHLLYVGVFNLGFCAVDRRSEQFLQWWWGHLRTECVHDPLSALFVDQKWVDIGSVLYDGTSFQHRGYNVSIANLHERPVDADADGYVIGSTGDRLRLFHFHAFDPDHPEQLTVRVEHSQDSLGEPVLALAKEYAASVVDKRALIGPTPPYGYRVDTTGRPISRRMRSAYRSALAGAEPGSLPSPFVAADAEAYRRWRRAAWRLVARQVVSDSAKGVRCVLPDEYDVLKKRFPRVAHAMRGRYVEKSGAWR